MGRPAKLANGGDHFKSRPDVEFTTRVIDDTSDPFPLAKGRFLPSKPPFSVEEELETLQDLGVASLVARNSGGTGGIEKVIAAERLGVEVVMVERPVLPETLRSASVEEALQMMEANGWLAGWMRLCLSKYQSLLPEASGRGWKP